MSERKREGERKKRGENMTCMEKGGMERKTKGGGMRDTVTEKKE